MCRKVLTSQLQAISPDAKVIDARKLVSPILQFALSISSRGVVIEAVATKIIRLGIL